MKAKREPWDHHGQTRQARGYGREHERIRAELMRDVILCEECRRQGRLAVGHVADHKVPLAKGGTSDRSNYHLLCRECAKAKDAKDRGQAYRPKLHIAADGWPIETKQ